MSFLSTLTFERKAVLALFAVSVTLAAIAMTALASLVGIMIDQRRTLADMQAAVATIDGKASDQPALGQATKRLFPARNSSEFQSALQSFVKDVAGRHQAVIETIQVLKSERVGGLSRVALKLDGVIPEPKLGALLADFATGEPLILLQAMELRTAIVQQNRINNGGTPVDAVQVRLDIVAYSAMTPPTSGGGK